MLQLTCKKTQTDIFCLSVLKSSVNIKLLMQWRTVIKRRPLYSRNRLEMNFYEGPAISVAETAVLGIN
jgi:hypothetical protein